MIVIVLVGDADHCGSSLTATCIYTDARYAALRGQRSKYQIYSLRKEGERVLNATDIQRAAALEAIGKQAPSPPPGRAKLPDQSSSSGSRGCCS